MQDTASKAPWKVLDFSLTLILMDHLMATTFGQMQTMYASVANTLNVFSFQASSLLKILSLSQNVFQRHVRFPLPSAALQRGVPVSYVCPR